MLTRFAKIGSIVGVERVMKSRVQISRLAIVCVMCASAMSGAFGAASVRSLGGAGTYSSASSAAGGALPVARGAVLRPIVARQQPAALRRRRDCLLVNILAAAHLSVVVVL